MDSGQDADSAAGRTHDGRTDGPRLLEQRRKGQPARSDGQKTRPPVVLA